MAALDRGGPADRGKSRRAHRLCAWSILRRIGALSAAIVFLAGIFPAFLVLWIRRKVPEPAEWSRRKRERAGKRRAWATFRGGALRDITHAEHRRLRHVADRLVGLHVLEPAAPAQSARSWPRGAPEARERLGSKVFFLVIGVSIFGIFSRRLAGEALGYRWAIALMCLGFFLA